MDWVGTAPRRYPLLFLLCLGVLACRPAQDLGASEPTPPVFEGATTSGATSTVDPAAPSSTSLSASAPTAITKSDLVPGDLTSCTVRFVIDGDTVDVGECQDAGRIRLILIDAPERDAACFSEQSTAFLRELLPEGSSVRLERDVSDVDQYGRKLRYLWTSEGMVNEAIVRAGHAWILVFPPDVSYREVIASAEDEARVAGRGVWGDCQAFSNLDQGECDVSYPTVCIPSPPPSLDCRDLPFRKFKALPPDPHEFDGDGDGVACEGP